MKTRGINKGDRCPESIGGCRRQPGVHRLPDELIFVAEDEGLAGFFATNMIDSSV